MTVTGTVSVGNAPSVTVANSPTVTANAGTGTFTVVQASGSSITIANAPTVTLSGTSTVTLSGTSIVRTNEVTSGVVASAATASTVANASTGTISYTVTSGKTFFFKGFVASSSGGPCKVVVDYGTTPTVITTGFYSTADPTWDFVFPQPVPISANTVVRIKIQNNAGTAQDCYATIWGVESDP